MFGQIGGLNAIGAPLSPNVVGGEDLIRYIGNDKLIYNFKSGSGTTVKDRSREGNDGTFGAGAAAPTWRLNSLYFDGGDYVDLTGISHGISTGGFTFCFSLDSLLASTFLFNQETVYISVDSYGNVARVYMTMGIPISDAGVDVILPIILQVTRDSSGNLECYINGASSDEGQSDATDITYNGISKIKLGSNYASSLYFLTGTMYSFRILNKGLSGIEAQNEYLCQKFSNN